MADVASGGVADLGAVVSSTRDPGAVELSATDGEGGKIFPQAGWGRTVIAPDSVQTAPCGGLFFGAISDHVIFGRPFSQALDLDGFRYIVGQGVGRFEKLQVSVDLLFRAICDHIPFNSPFGPASSEGSKKNLRVGFGFLHVSVEHDISLGKLFHAVIHHFVIGAPFRGAVRFCGGSIKGLRRALLGKANYGRRDAGFQFHFSTSDNMGSPHDCTGTFPVQFAVVQIRDALAGAIAGAAGRHEYMRPDMGGRVRVFYPNHVASGRPRVMTAPAGALPPPQVPVGAL